MAPRPLSRLASLLMLATMAMAFSIVPINGSVPVNESASIELFISNPAQVMVPFAPVAPLSPNALNLPPPGLAGQLFSATADNQLSISEKDIALISCDQSDYGGNIKAADVYGQAESSQARAVLLYSAYSDYCAIYGAPNVYNYTYTMKRNNDTLVLLNGIRSLNGGTIWAGFNTLSAASDPSSSSNNSSTAGASQDPGGPAPSTAVAMIILYSITGLITALFLGIIITGAVRAHRHPERYGPRQVAGRIRQSRARGLAKAMLDSLPIVKFGDRQEPAKPTDVELENGVPREASPTPATNNVAGQQTAERGTAGTGAEGETDHDGGIAPAAGGSRTEGSAPPPEENQGCSICTEDFEVGQDQRVLPCDHRFHPACVDPWLLNVSGTCPLCRIDLRGESADTEEGGADAGTTAMAPPLNETNPASPADRNSRRRTVMLAIIGQFRADHMTREERLAALRRFREQYDAQRAENSNRVPMTAEATEEEESSMRRRFRRVLRITTRRPSPPTDQHTATPTEEPQNRSTETS